MFEFSLLQVCISTGLFWSLWKYLHVLCVLHYNWNTSSGIDDNEIMKVRGQGGADVERNKPGDLFLTIKVTFLFCQIFSSICQFNRYFAIKLWFICSCCAS
jgi:hypothetical protein